MGTSWAHPPAPHPSKYRLYTTEDVKLLKRARFLRKVRGLNAPAILQFLKREGLARPASDAAARAIGSRLRQLRVQRGLISGTSCQSCGHFCRISKRTGTFAHERDQWEPYASSRASTKLRFWIFLTPLNPAAACCPAGTRKVLEAGQGVRMELLAWGNTVMEPHLFRIAPRPAAANPYTHEGEEFIYVLRGRLEISVDGRSIG